MTTLLAKTLIDLVDECNRDLTPIDEMAYQLEPPITPGLPTVYSGGVAVHAKQPAIAKQFLRFLASPEAAATIKKSGMEPVSEQLTTSGNSRSETTAHE